MNYLDLLNAVIPVLGIMAAGFVIRRLNWLTAQADASLMKVVVNLLTPCLIADSILGNAAFERAGNVFLPPVLGFATTAGGILLGWSLRHALGRDVDDPAKRTFAVTVGICNYGYIPLPLAQLLFSAGTVGVLFVQNVGVELAMWLVGIAMLGGRSWRDGWRRLINPPVVAILATLILNGMVERDRIPVPAIQAIQLLGRCAIPMGLILVGATIADLVADVSGWRGWRVMLFAIVVRLILLPLMIIALARILPVSREIREVLLLHAAMPAAVFPIIMARHFGGDAATALRVVLGTSLAGVVSIPVWLKLGIAFLELGTPGLPQ